MDMRYEPPTEEGDPLEKYTVNLTALAKSGKLDPIIGRDEQIRRVIQILSRRTKNNPVLLGDPGVGKTAIAEGLAQRIVSGDVPETLHGKQLLSLDLAGLVAGAAYRGEFEKRIKSVLEAIEKGEGNYILFIDELHTIVGTGAAEGAIDASNILKPALARGLLHAIGATTIKEYREHIERDAALERRFQPVYVEEPAIEDAVAILRGIKEKYEAHHGIRISDDAIISAVNLSVRYITERFLPDKAIDLIDEAAAAAKIEIDSMPTELDTTKRRLTQLDIELAALKREKGIEQRKQKLEKEKDQLKKKFDGLNEKWLKEKKIVGELSRMRVELDGYKSQLDQAERDALLEKAAQLKYEKIPELEKQIKELESKWAQIPEEQRLLPEEVTGQDVAKIVSRWTSIPVTRLLSSESERYAKLEEELRRRVVGQYDALKKVANAIRRSRAGLSDKNKPIGSFLFLGPTGVGKTETAKALAHSLFNDEKAMIRIDMSEYQESHTVARLIGAPPGYVGFEEGGQLTEAVRRKPYSVVLFDETEKAHQQVFNIFLQILDEGRLTDGRGRVVDFKNTILILTSNLGSEAFGEKENFEKQQNYVLQKVKEHFRPEFINRLDSLVVFQPLSREMIKEIVGLQIEQLKTRVGEQNVLLNVTDAARKHFENVGFDPLYGARPLKRVINEQIVDELALQLIEGKIKPGSKVNADYKRGKVLIQAA